MSREIRRYGSPLDRYSFPSGHTLHAVSSAVVLEALVPGSNLVSWPLAVLIGVSRVVLGLHYPSDVLAGATLGLAIGSTWVWLDLAV